MLLLIQNLILGAVQGITEFLPVSSSGHLLILEKLFSIKENLVLLNLILHAGTVLAVICFLWKDILNIFRQKNWILIKNLFIAFITTSVFGFLIKGVVENVFIYSSSLIPLALGFLFTAIILFLTVKITNNKRDANTMTVGEAIKIGFVQAIAIIPGISRSGMTYFATIKNGIKKEDAFKFSFLLSIPTILAATMVEMISERGSLMVGINATHLLLGLLISFIFGILGLYIFKYIIKASKIWIFSIYLICLATILLII